MRTPETFAREAVERGRTREEVRSIALSTRWQNNVAEVLKEYDRLAKQAEAA
jgi:hypothetical protein